MSVWMGLGLDSTSENDLMSLDFEAGIPAWVHTTNSAVKASFSKRTGFRAEASASFLLPGVALCSENRWQRVSFGVNTKC